MEKPEKPYPEFPLFAHGTGQWAKKIRGKTWYFGVWRDWQAALNLYLEQRDAIQAGRDPYSPEGITLHDVCDKFMISRRARVTTGEMTERTWREYYTYCEIMLSVFGKKTKVAELSPSDFEKLRGVFAEKYAPSILGNAVQRIRSLFKYAYETELIDKPVRLGPEFKKPSQKTMREVRNSKPKQLLTRTELRKLISAAEQPMKCMILLAINCGFGQGDLAGLRMSAIHLPTGWIRFPRPKTAIMRECPLWPETIAAIKAVKRARQTPEDPALSDILFITRKGFPFQHYNEKSGGTTDAILLQFLRLRKRLKIFRPGNNFYAIRHTFQTVADGTKDAVAIRRIMGHSAPQGDMSENYREEISAERLIAVTDHVHEWLFS